MTAWHKNVFCAVYLDLQNLLKCILVWLDLEWVKSKYGYKKTPTLGV